MKLSSHLACALLIAWLAAGPVLAEGREQLKRGTATHQQFDRDRLLGQFVFDPSLGNAAFSISAQEYDTLLRAMAKVRNLTSRGLETDGQLLAGLPGNPGLDASEIAIMQRLGMSNDYKRAGTAYVRPNTHRRNYYVFDIDRILEPQDTTGNPNGLPGVVVHYGEPTVYQVDVSIPVKEIRYERQLSKQSEQGLTGGWSPTTSTDGSHYRLALDQFATRASGKLAKDPDTGGLVTLQMVGPGDWYGWSTEADPTLNARYSFDPTSRRFRVAMAFNNDDGSPNVFVAGGHIHCGFIYDFGNPLNCHKTARTGDPSTQGGNPYGDTVVVAVDNRGRDN
jgi:hypothetical protein